VWWEGEVLPFLNLGDEVYGGKDDGSYCHCSSSANFVAMKW
jgi:hypothetical protein